MASGPSRAVDGGAARAFQASSASPISSRHSRKPMLQHVALALVTLAGGFLFVLGLVALATPPQAKRFFLGFAQTAGRHYLELAIRMVLGAALLLAAPRMAGSAAVEVAGWVLLGTTAMMLFVPWRSHRAFAQRVVPRALTHLSMIAVASMAGGAAIIWSVYASSAA